MQLERFLYRLSQSPYAHRFFLKGGLMFMVWDAENHRATMDIDFLAKISNDVDFVRRIIETVTSIEIEGDGITFDTQKLILKKVQVGGDYEGINVSFSAHLFSAKIPIIIDIGFNDVIIPQPEKISYPTLFKTPSPQLMGYTFETVFAEKLEAIVKLSLVNTRMKDFYDLWAISQMKELDIKELETAILRVFENRNNKLEFPLAFTEQFYSDSQTIQIWKQFLLRVPRTVPTLENIVKEIVVYLSPIFEKLQAGAEK